MSSSSPTGSKLRDSVLRRAGSACNSRPRSRRSGRRSSASAVARRAVASSVSAMLDELGGLQPAAADRPLDGRPDVARRADADPGTLDQQRAGLVGLIEAARHDDRVVGRFEGLGKPARRRERCRLGEARPHERELQQGDRALVHRRSVETRAVSAPSAARTRTGGRRRGTATAGWPTAPPRRRRRSARVVRIASGGIWSTGPSRRTGDAGSHRSSPVTRRSIPNAAPTSPGPLASRSSGVRSRRARSAASSRPRLRRRSAATRARSARMVDSPSSGSTARTSTADAPPSGPVTTFRQSYIP